MTSAELAVLQPHKCTILEKISSLHLIRNQLYATIPFVAEPDRRLLRELGELTPKPLKVEVVADARYIAIDFGWYAYNSEHASMLQDEIEQLFKEFTDRKVVRKFIF